MKPLDIRTETVELQAFRFGVGRRFSPHELQDFGVELLSRTGEHMAVELHACIYGRNLDGQEIRYPATWWDAFKERWFPAWALRRWPVVRVVVQAKARELFPGVKALPGQRAIRVQWFDSPRLLVEPPTETP